LSVTSRLNSRAPIVAALLARAAARGSAVAISGEDSTLTYRELIDGAVAIAESLLAEGLTPHQTVHVRVSNVPSDFVALIGIWLAQGVAVPLHRSSPPAAVDLIRQRSHAAFEVDSLATAKTDRIKRTATVPADGEAQAILANAALVIFTSGSTGIPKGVVLSHTALAGKLAANDSLLHFDANDRILLVLNNSFSFGIWVSLLTILKGGVLVTRSRFSADNFLRDLQLEGVTRVGVVPTMMRTLFAGSVPKGVDLPELRQILIGGESLGHSLSKTLRKTFHAAELIDIYGLTETATSDFFLFPQDYKQHPNAVGHPGLNVSFRIADPDNKPLPNGQVGELQIRSPYLMNGYLGDPKTTADTLVDGWLRTGDLAFTSDGRFVEIAGRRKELIVRGGNKVYPLEIEQHIAAHPAVREALAVGVADTILGERIHALIILRSKQDADFTNLRRFLADRLDRFKLPDAIYVGTTLPLGSTGKADRGQLARLIREGAIAPAWQHKGAQTSPSPSLSDST